MSDLERPPLTAGSLSVEAMINLGAGRGMTADGIGVWLNEADKQFRLEREAAKARSAKRLEAGIE